MPTRKWWAASAVSAAGLVATFVTDKIVVAVVTLVAARVVAWLVPNDVEAADNDSLPNVPTSVTPAPDIGDKGSA